MFASKSNSSEFRHLFFAVVTALALGLASKGAMAINASPHAVHVTQPDGTEIVLRGHGDERFHWEEDANGYSVLLKNGRYVYARRAQNGRLVPTEHEVGKVNPRAVGLSKRILPDRAVIAQQRANAPGSETNDTQGPAEQAGPSGQVVNLVIPIRFSNHASRTVPVEGDIGVLFNNTGPDPLAPTGSVRDVYLENSYGQLDLVSTIADWATVSNTEQYYANGMSGDQTLHQALIEALNAVDQYIDFSQFDQDNDGYIDAITFLHSGYGAEWGGFDSDGTHYDNRIWSHRWVLWDTDGNGQYNSILDQPWESGEGVKVWDYHISPALWGTSGSNIGRIGVIAHETGHFFGLPDLYDTTGGGEGIGSYGLMANSWGFDFSQLYPPHFSPWSKVGLGWITPTVLSLSGQYTLDASEDQPDYFRVDNGYPSGEYLLIENRQPLDFDGDMPQGGLAIWHIDEQANDTAEGYPGQVTGGTPWPENGRHYRVALLQADGFYNLERGNNRGDGGDVWQGNGVNEINSNTLPDTDTYQDGVIFETGNRIFNVSVSAYSMTFEYEDGTPVLDPPTAPTNLSASHDGNGNVDLIWTDNAINEDGYRVLRDDVEIKLLSANSENYTDSNLPNGIYDYYVQAFNTAGTADSLTEMVTVDVPETFVAYAGGESTTYGTISGSYANTVDVGDVEAITETQSGGRKSNRHSRLDHVWQVDNVNPGGSPMVLLTVNAHAPVNAEGDDFEFLYSTNGGASYTTAFTLAQGEGKIMNMALPAGTNGRVDVRVRDTDRTKGNSTLDSVSVRQLYIEWSDEVVLTAPSNLTATPSETNIQLTWTHGTGHVTYDVEEFDGSDWLAVATDLGPTTDTYTHGSPTEGSTHTYRVCGIDATSQVACSDIATATVGVQLPVLTASGYKDKGWQYTSLSWTDLTVVDIYRDDADYDSPIYTNVSGASYDDDIGKKGGGDSYVYQVCAAGGTSNCSNTDTVTF